MLLLSWFYSVAFHWQSCLGNFWCPSLLYMVVLLAGVRVSQRFLLSSTLSPFVYGSGHCGSDRLIGTSMALASPLMNSPTPGNPSHLQATKPSGGTHSSNSSQSSRPASTGSGEAELPATPSTLLSVGFNQDYGCFACGTDTGFRIYNCDPFKETFRREFNNGGIGLVEMLFRCNILAVVGGGTTPRYPTNKVMIWDDHQSRCIGELSFRSEVRAVRLRRDRIVVILEHKIYVYNFADLKLLHQIETTANPKGLCALSPATSSSVLACPGLHRGQVLVM